MKSILRILIPGMLFLFVSVPSYAVNYCDGDAVACYNFESVGSSISDDTTDGTETLTVSGTLAMASRSKSGDKSLIMLHLSLQERCGRDIRKR